MTETLSTIPARVEVASLSQELPSLSFVLSLPDYDPEKGLWHGRVNVHGRSVDISLTMYDSDTFPVWAVVSVSSGGAAEEWKFEQKADSIKWGLVANKPQTMLLPHVVAPQQQCYGVGFSLGLRRPMHDPHGRICTDDINWHRSTISGAEGAGNVVLAANELVDVVRAIRAS
ncbi:MAG: hypothetical protein HY376_00015 [Candidatus Blackburnbacteria bacterium]|nr:hypothetical protein [Candidatus Blackburnbacteria bacterium]